MIVFAHLFGAQRDRGWALFAVVCGLVFITPITVASYGAGRTGGVGKRDGLFQRIAGTVAWPDRSGHVVPALTLLHERGHRLLVTHH
jgi:hypothetical protein